MDRENLIYPDLSYKITGLAFKVFNTAGYGMNEKFYQKAFAEELKNNNINFEREKLIKINYGDKSLGNYFMDFLVDNKIVVELRVRPKFGYTDIKQVVGYLRNSGHKLAIMVYFTRSGVKYRRIINAV